MPGELAGAWDFAQTGGFARTYAESGAIAQTGGSGTYYAVVGKPEPEEGKWPVAQYRTVSPGYLDAIGIRLLRGRDVQPTDRFDGPRVMLVNEAFVQRHWQSWR